MTGSVPRPGDARAELAALADQVDTLTRELNLVQARLRSLSGVPDAGEPQPGAHPARPSGPVAGGAWPAHPQAQQAPQHPPRFPPQQAPWPGGQPGAGSWPTGRPGAAPRPGLPAHRPMQLPRVAPRPQREGFGPKLIAWAGGTVTLLGILLLLVLAANRGWLAPGVRVVGGAVLALALIGVAAWVRTREGGRVGALALAATGFAGLYLDVAAATALYEHVPVAAGLVLAVVVAGAGLAVADWWESESLAVGVVLGAAVLAVGITGLDPVLVALVVILQAAAVPAVFRRRWSTLAVVAGLFPAVYGLLAVLAVALDDDQERPITVAAAAVFVVGVAVAVGCSRRLSAAECAVLLTLAPLPLLAAALLLGQVAGALVALGVAVVLGLIGAVRLPLDVPAPVRVVATAYACLAVFEATLLVLRGGAQTTVLLAEAVVLAVAAVAVKQRALLIAAGVFGLVGAMIAVVRDAPLGAIAAFPVEPYVDRGVRDTEALVVGLGASALVVAAAVAIILAAARLGLLARAEGPLVWVPTAAVGLYGSTSLLVTAALLITTTRAGFLGGHVAVTVSWAIAGLVLLIQGIRRTSLRFAGSVLVTAAIVKLFLFDLSQLDGFARALAFLVTGLVLLAAGTRYARLVAAARKADGQQSSGPGSAQPGPGTQGWQPHPGAGAQPPWQAAPGRSPYGAPGEPAPTTDPTGFPAQPPHGPAASAAPSEQSSDVTVRLSPSAMEPEAPAPSAADTAADTVPAAPDVPEQRTARSPRTAEDAPEQASQEPRAQETAPPDETGPDTGPDAGPDRGTGERPDQPGPVDDERPNP